jgi:hypothetical protein
VRGSECFTRKSPSPQPSPRKRGEGARGRCFSCRPFGEPHVQPSRSPHRRSCHRGDLRDRRRRLHAAVADLTDHQFRAGRIRHAAGLPDAGGDACWRTVLAGDPDWHRAVAAAAGPRLQDAAGRSNATPWRAAAGDCDHGPGHRHQGSRQAILERRSLALSLDHSGRRYHDFRPRRRPAEHWRAGAGDPRRARPDNAAEPHLHRSPDAGCRAEPDRRAHHWRARRTHDPADLPDQRVSGRAGLAAHHADLSRQVLQRRSARPGRVHRRHCRRLQPGPRRHRWRVADRRRRQSVSRLCLHPVSRRCAIGSADRDHSVSAAGHARPPEERTV